MFVKLKFRKRLIGSKLLTVHDLLYRLSTTQNLKKEVPVNNTKFINQFSENIKFNYTCFDRVIIRGYILKFFSTACVVLFLKAMGFPKKTNGVMRIFTDQLNSHIPKQAKKLGAQIYCFTNAGNRLNSIISISMMLFLVGHAI